MSSSIVLIGPRYSEKTQVGAELSKLLEAPFIDIDNMFADICKTSAEDFAEKYGVERFREYESKLITKICAIYKDIQSILKPGAEAVVHDQGDQYREENKKRLSEFGAVFYLLPVRDLEESAGILAERMRRYPAGQIPSLTRENHRHYLAAADAVVYTEGKTVQEVANEISQFIG